MLQKHEDLQPQSPFKTQDDITCFSPSAGRNEDKGILGALLLSQSSWNRLSDSLPQWTRWGAVERGSWCLPLTSTGSHTSEYNMQIVYANTCIFHTEKGWGEEWEGEGEGKKRRKEGRKGGNNQTQSFPWVSNWINNISFLVLRARQNSLQERDKHQWRISWVVLTIMRGKEDSGTNQPKGYSWRILKALGGSHRVNTPAELPKPQKNKAGLQQASLPMWKNSNPVKKESQIQMAQQLKWTASATER